MALLKILTKEANDHTFFVYITTEIEDVNAILSSVSNAEIAQVQKPKYSTFETLLYKILNKIFSKFNLKKRWKKKDVYDLIIKKYSIDIIHTPTQSVVKRKGVKSISTLHDVQELYYPQFFNSSQRAYRAANHKNAIDNADVVVVSYDHVKKDIHKYFDKPIDQIQTVLLDMNDLWFNKFILHPPNFINTYKIHGPFLLYPASTWEHKNHLTLIKALKALDDPNILLICTGHPTTYYEKVLKPFIDSHGMNEQVKFIGIVSDEELFELYKSCLAVVVPTLYEAGSFPLMESILLGVPVICANTTSLPETIGNPKFVFEPTNTSDMVDKLNKICTNDVYRKENLMQGEKQATLLRNNNAGQKFDAIYKSMVNGAS